MVLAARGAAFQVGAHSWNLSIGVRARQPFRVYELAAPPRLVIDIRQ